jgi:methanogenic corrinoid protein MtbC1
MPATAPATLPWALADPLRRERRRIAESVAERQRRELRGLAAGRASEQHETRVAEAEALVVHLAQAMALTEPKLFVDQVAWIKQALATHGIPGSAVKRNLQFLQDALEDAVSPAALGVAVSILSSARARLDAVPDAPPSELARSAPLAETAALYTEHLVAGEAERARRLVFQRVAAGTPPDAILLDVITPAQHEIGRLWQVGRIEVAQEHFATAAGQRIMAELLEAHRRFIPAPAPGTFVGACVAGERHDVGLHLVCDLFRLDGWAVHELGTDVAHAAILDAVRQHRPAVLGLSVTMSGQVWHAAEVIAALRAEPAIAQTHVLVGGRPFRLSPSLAQWIGADAGAGDARTARAQAAAWVASA